MAIELSQLQRILEAAIMAAGRPLNLADMQKLFEEADKPTTNVLREALEELAQHYHARGIQLVEVASGFQFQASSDLSAWISKLWEERPPRYSRALLETLALVAYRQPITRAEIEEVRGVSVSSHIIKTLMEREWVRVVGYRDVPGKPALYATTKSFLDHLNLKNLSELPALSALPNLEDQAEKLQVQLELANLAEQKNEGDFEAEREESVQESNESLTDAPFLKIEQAAVTASDGSEQDTNNQDIETINATQERL